MSPSLAQQTSEEPAPWAPGAAWEGPAQPSGEGLCQRWEPAFRAQDIPVLDEKAWVCPVLCVSSVVPAPKVPTSGCWFR